MWDGKTYVPLGSGIGTGGNVNALAVDSNNNIYVGGAFTLLGDGTTANNIAKWDSATSTWSILGSGVNGTVKAIGIDSSDNIYVGGTFTSAGGVTVSNIAKWTSSAPGWSNVGGGVTGTGTSTVNSIAISFNDVYVGGIFTSTGGSSGTPTVAANNIAKWNSTASTWSALGAVPGGVNGTVNSIAIESNNYVFVGGNFTTANNTALPANNIAVWGPIASTPVWSSLGSGGGGVNGTVNSIAIDSNDNIYVGGAFTTAKNSTTSNISANYIAKWINGSQNPSWQTVGQFTGYNNGLSSAVSSISINNSNNDIYTIASINTSLNFLSTNYINLVYNNNLIQQLFLDGQITNIFTKNNNGNKVCAVQSIINLYQNIY